MVDLLDPNLLFIAIADFVAGDMSSTFGWTVMKNALPVGLCLKNTDRRSRYQLPLLRYRSIIYHIQKACAMGVYDLQKQVIHRPTEI